MEGKIVYHGKSKNGTEIFIRYPEIIDVQVMTNYINTLSDERTFITYQGEHETLEGETQYLTSQLEKIKNKKLIQLLVFANDNLVGISTIELGIRTGRHVGLLGISIGKEFRNLGIGRLLIEHVINEAVENLSDLEIITLGVFSGNSKAIEWYKKLGFVEEGRLPNGIKIENGYQDHIYMYKPVK